MDRAHGQATATRSYAAGGALLSTTSTTYNANGQVATTTDALGNITHSYYDLAGRSVRTISPDGTSSETLYDSAGRAYFSADRHLATDTLVRGTLSIYDLAGRSIESRRIEGVQLEIVQDEATHLASVRLATGQPALDTLAYLSASQTHYNDKGQVDYTISPTGARTEYLYDAAGRATIRGRP
jgi:YD repeat-containing protein